MAQTALPKVQVLAGGSATDMLLCREQTEIGLDDLHAMIAPCKPAYEESATVPQSTPHTRIDILDWMPLEP
jgi:hypothetical protein